ncbi:DUF423 domain-containing protein [Flavobacteriaceae bacterium TP-CH-4]|uniref:DUF423 domain-containing protein n=1 Tax=Pelagihabitans pacificus TaxID=2696054 RepID=A0A967AW44_9FLAO|nr:DUF423 domain-containing protein [Pelagihabitans pacificus]NHF58677.1 DUF423 domain-containing protein [Pelagihabitans pacificus]
MNRTIFVTGCILGALAVALGAFAAHGLEKLVDTAAIDTFQTGVRYQMYHALVLLILGKLGQLPDTRKRWIFYALLTGILLFSFSIYFLATNELTSFDFRTIGFITPVGGVFLMVGWGLLGFGCLRYFD